MSTQDTTVILPNSEERQLRSTNGLQCSRYVPLFFFLDVIKTGPPPYLSSGFPLLLLPLFLSFYHLLTRPRVVRG